jgi:hypothetical protein
VLGCLVLMTLGAAPALAAPSWSSPPTNLVTPIVKQYAEEPQVAVDAKGDAVAVWRESTVLGEDRIEADVRPATSSVWEAPVAISTSEYPSDPHVAIDAEGEAVAVWTASNDHAVHYVVQAATGSAITGKWQTAVTVSPETQYANEPQIAVNATGQAVAAWQGRYPSELIEAAVEPVKGEWQTPVDISGAAGMGEAILTPRVTIDSPGDTVAVWIDYNGSEHIESSTRPADAAWLTPVTLSGTGQATSPQVAADASGDALATWTDYANETIQSVQGSAGSGTWQTPVDVGPNPENHGSPDLAVNARGDALVTWGHNRSTESISTRAALGSALTGEWQAPIAVIPPSEKDTSVGKVTLDPQGDALAIWSDEEGGETVVQAAAMPTGTGSFSAPVSLSTTGEDVNEPQVAFGGAGIGVAAWEEGEEDANTPDATIVQAAEYTGTVLVPVAPTVVTGPSSAVGQTSATVAGTVNPNGSEVSACYFEYGTNMFYGSKASCSQTVGSGEARVAASASLPGLNPDTTYHYRVVATNAVEPSYGADKTFTTESVPLVTPIVESPTPATSPATTAPASTPSTATSVGVASTPKAVEELLQGCSSSPVVLNDVYIQGSHVFLSGSAAKSFVGKKVKILFNEGKSVATATVEANGQYTTTAPLPPAKVRDNLNTRYTAEIGKLRSVHLKLVRRLLLESPKASGTTITLAGQLTLPLTKPIAPVTVEQQLECGKTTIAKTFTPAANGHFHITLTVPANAKAAIFRLTSKVAANKHSVTHGFTTFSLPLPVAIG